MRDAPRMFIDVVPPVDPQDGDVWINRGKLRKYEAGWNPPWAPDPPQIVEVDVMSLYPKVGRKKGSKNKKHDGVIDQGC